MPPYTADSARSSHTKTDRPTSSAPRIVPAVPLAFTRQARSKKSPAETPTTPTADRVEKQDGEQAVTGAQETHNPDVAVAEANGVPQEHEESRDQTPDTAAVQTPPEDAVNGDAKPEEAANGPPHEAEVLDAIEEDSAPTDKTTHLSAHEYEAMPQTTQQAPALPTPFVPPEMLSTPTSANSTAPINMPPPLPPLTMHQPRPSANGIVFGGHPDSSNSSPAPPQSGNMPYPMPPPPGFMGANYGPPPFFIPGHGHHMSEPQMSMPYPMAMPPPPTAFDYRRDRHQHVLAGHAAPFYPQNAASSYRMPPQEPFSPGQGPNYTNGLARNSRSGSQSSSRGPDHDMHRIPDQRRGSYVPQQRPHALLNGTHPSAPPGPNDTETSMALRDWLCSHFGNRDFADYILEVTRNGAEETLMEMPIHGLVVARSHAVLALMASYRPASAQEGLPKQIKIATQDKYLDGFALSEALKYLYGGPLLSLTALMQGLQPFANTEQSIDSFSIPRQRMEQALAYAAAGVLLRVEPVVRRGFENIRGLLRWDTVEKALAFALDGGIGPFWRSEPNHDGDGNTATSRSSLPTYGEDSVRLLHDILQFLIHNFPVDFSLDRTASQSTDFPLLPTINDSRPPSHHPRLSQIRFGDVPIEDRPTFVAITLSRILLSVPFPILKALLEHFILAERLGGAKLSEVVRAVNEERESRRLTTSKKVRSSQPAKPVDTSLADNLEWRETVENGPHGTGTRLGRYRVAVETEQA